MRNLGDAPHGPERQDPNRDKTLHGAAEATSSAEAQFGTDRALSWLRRELRRERARGRSGHWTYNLSRHLALLRDVRRAEGEALTARPAPLPGTRRAAPAPRLSLDPV
ncbi:hypothetical protein DLJ53_16945 [Acuticoccus sediminis]|uniref:Uncharacterized protein n=1 Tax=Acuticoccus sediminis TaxID=2184697 RepID=A0A8B2NUE3_9HYPH|nr:hypothetical protein DLJ53_16945 [Acuticoccus sediminis]